MDDIRQYWNSRSKEAGGDPSATTNDIYLRKLESLTVTNELLKIIGEQDAKILDVGCGDGQTTLALAARFPRATFRGIDFSSEMIASAQNTLQTKNISARVEFFVDDARELGSLARDMKFDIILTNRCLINITDREEQWVALDQIAKHLTPGGWYLGTENFLTGQSNLNAVRKSVELPEIPIRWHNLYFQESEFVEYARQHFRSVELVNFSSAYYFITRCVYSALCMHEGVSPNYKHHIHEVAVKIPAFGDFSPIKLIRAKL
jgi:ubiquinone/menaquinone biosynthesis C-methylase UbiE